MRRTNPLDALGNPLRRELLLALRRGPLPVHALAARFPVSRPAISRHMKQLESAGLVETQREGRESVYAVRLQGFASVREFLDGFWDVALDRLTAMARKERATSRSSAQPNR